MLLGDDIAAKIERDPFVDRDAEVLGAGAAGLQCRQQFGVRGDAGAAPDQFDAGALIDIGLPADLAQERRGEQAGHGPTNDDSAPLAPLPA